MFKDLKVGTKISGGFAVGLILTAVIGLVAIYYMADVGGIVKQLATQEIPETSAVVETERAMWQTHVLSYEFDIKLNEESKQEWFDQREQVGKAADKIIPIATALNHAETVQAANDVKAKLKEYAGIGKEYAAMAMANKELEKQLGEDASVIEKQWIDYIDSQNEKLKKAIGQMDLDEVASRVDKLEIANDAIDLFNTALRNQYLYQIDLHKENADRLYEAMKELAAVAKDIADRSTDPADKERADTAVTHGDSYLQHMDQWISNKEKQKELLEQSDAAATWIVSLTSKTAVQADKDAYDIGIAAVDLVHKVKLLLIALLIGTILIGSTLAFSSPGGLPNPSTESSKT